MSEAWVSTAREMIWLTRRITGASLARSFSRSVSSSSARPRHRRRVGRRFLVRVEALERGIQFDRHGDLQAHAHVDGGGDGRGREAVERIGQRHHQRLAVHRHRHGARIAQEARRQTCRRTAAGRSDSCRHARPAGRAASHRPRPGPVRRPGQAGAAPCPAAGRSPRPRGGCARAPGYRTGRSGAGCPSGSRSRSRQRKAACSSGIPYWSGARLLHGTSRRRGVGEALSSRLGMWLVATGRRTSCAPHPAPWPGSSGSGSACGNGSCRRRASDRPSSRSGRSA